MGNFLNFLKANQYLLSLALCLFSGVILIVLVVELVAVIKRIYKMYKNPDDKESLMNAEYNEHTEGRGEIIRKLICADAIDPGPNGYMVLAHGSKEYYVRTFTISKMPARVDFAKTFGELMNLPDCISSWYVHPISESSISAKMDRHIHIIESEFMSTHDSNRKRRLTTERVELEKWAREVETGSTRLFNVGALFTFYSEDLRDLNNISDQFKAKADGKGIGISNCYALQPEAFLANAPLNAYMGMDSEGVGLKKYLSPSAAMFHLMDTNSVSALYNYTQTTFSHKHGIYLGRDLFLRKPVFFDIYDPSHLSFCGALFGNMGAGKSALVKIMAIRNSLLGYRFCALDGQMRKGMGAGEYADLARELGGINFEISNDSSNVLNLFDVTESIVTERNEYGELEEKVTLELKKTKSFIVSMLFRIIQGDKVIQDFSLYTYLHKTVTNLVTKLYDEFGIYDKDASSLYEKGQKLNLNKGELSSGFSRKNMPTFSDFYKLLIREAFRNADETLVEAYNLILASLGDYIKEVYYSSLTGRIFTREEFMELSTDILTEGGVPEKVFVNDAGERERIVSVRGTRTYFDGQSTLDVNLKTCPFLNIDICKLQEEEKPIARIVGMGFLNEHVIKKNSDVLGSADKLLLIIDEFHEIIKDAVKASGDESQSDGDSILDTVENIIRTARKRNVGMLLISQTVKDFLKNSKCESIVGLLSYAFISKQPLKDRKALEDTFGLTENQSRLVVDYIGGKDKQSEEEKKKRAGEFCLVDVESQRVCFLKSDYFKAVEAFVVETDPVELSKMRSVG